MTPDEERWAEAGQILKWKGDDASAFVAERLTALGSAGDVAGVERFQAIATRLAGLIDAARV